MIRKIVYTGYDKSGKINSIIFTNPFNRTYKYKLVYKINNREIITNHKTITNAKNKIKLYSLRYKLNRN